MPSFIPDYRPSGNAESRSHNGKIIVAMIVVIGFALALIALRFRVFTPKVPPAATRAMTQPLSAPAE